MLSTFNDGPTSGATAQRTRNWDMSGEISGYLRAITPVESSKEGRKQFLCECTLCGATRVVSGDALRRKKITRCKECAKELKATARRKHGATAGSKKSRAYVSYECAKARCTNPNTRGWKRYGGAGIKFLYESFEQLVAEIGEPQPGETLDRIDRRGPYAPGNVQWADKYQQNANRSSAVMVCYQDEQMCLATFCLRVGCQRYEVDRLRKKFDFSPQEAVIAITQPTPYSMRDVPAQWETHAPYSYEGEVIECVAA